MKKNLILGLSLLITTVISSKPIQAQGIVSCDLSSIGEIKIDVTPAILNSCPGNITVTITDSAGYIPGSMFLVKSRDSTGAETEIGTITLTDYDTGQVSGIGNYNTIGSYTIFLTDTARIRCSEPKPLDVNNCSIPTPTPTPDPGATCLSSGASCSTQIANPCCNPSQYECVPDSVGSFTGECKIPVGGPQPTVAPTPFPDFQPCAGFSIDGLGEDPAPGYEEEFPACQTCHDSNGTYTALGCIPNDPSQFAGAFIRILFTISGGIAFLIILYGSFLCLTSRGSTERTQSCRETITAAVVGLLLIIFSLIIINILFGFGGIFTGVIPNTLFRL